MTSDIGRKAFKKMMKLQKAKIIKEIIPLNECLERSNLMFDEFVEKQMKELSEKYNFIWFTYHKNSINNTLSFSRSYTNDYNECVKKNENYQKIQSNEENKKMLNNWIRKIFDDIRFLNKDYDSIKVTVYGNSITFMVGKKIKFEKDEKLDQIINDLKECKETIRIENDTLFYEIACTEYKIEGEMFKDILIRLL